VAKAKEKKGVMKRGVGKVVGEEDNAETCSELRDPEGLEKRREGEPSAEGGGAESRTDM